MKIYSTYKVKIKHYNSIFKNTVTIYRHAVDYLIHVCLDNYDSYFKLDGNLNRQRYIESLIHKTKENPNVSYDFDEHFYKMPSYMRRCAINEAIGKVSSYKSNHANWLEDTTKGKEPSKPIAGYVYPSYYRDNMYKETEDPYTVKIKVFVRNTWDWINVQLRKSDKDYIYRHCNDKKVCVPTLQKRGQGWYLDFPIEEQVKLKTVDIKDQVAICVDLGINHSATMCAMRSDGTILDRRFIKLSKEIDSLTHSLNRIKKAQQHGNRKMPRLWARTNGYNHDISVKTANEILIFATQHNADVIVFEHLDKKSKKQGSKKQRLALWRSAEVQRIVTHKAHELGMRISHINAKGTSQLAYDESGKALRGKKAGFKSYSLCQFQNGKIYNCDLSASYNIGARYFIRELLKSLSESSRLHIEAKVPQCSKRSTCTLSTLINLNAVLAS